MEERLYSLNDANFNTTALVTSGGMVAERFLYDPYGQVTTASGTPANPSADNAWIYLHQGGRWDSATGMYNFRNRDFSPTLMRWTTNDPIGFGGGDTNTYRYVGNGPGNGADPTGLALLANGEGAGNYLESLATTVTGNAPGVLLGVGFGMGLLALAVAAPPVIAFTPACILGVLTYRGFKEIGKNLFESFFGTDAETMKPLTAKELGERHGNFVLNAVTFFSMVKFKVPIGKAQANLNAGVKTLFEGIPEKMGGPLPEPKVGPSITAAKSGTISKAKANWFSEIFKRAETLAYNLGVHYKRNYAAYVGVIGKDGVPRAYHSTPNIPNVKLGKHAEVNAYESLKQAGLANSPKDLQFTQPYCWRKPNEGAPPVWTPLPVCKTCQKVFSKSQFPENVIYETGGPWDAAGAAVQMKAPLILRPIMSPGEKVDDE